MADCWDAWDFRNIYTDRSMAISSAAGVASQIPFTPRKAGSTSMVTSINTKEREKAKIGRASCRERV